MASSPNSKPTPHVRDITAATATRVERYQEKGRRPKSTPLRYASPDVCCPGINDETDGVLPLKSEIARGEAMEIIGEIVHIDLEIGLAVAVGVALHRHEGAVLDEM
jgi:hypothetical protein